MTRIPEVEITRLFRKPEDRVQAFLDFGEMVDWEGGPEGWEGWGSWATRATPISCDIEESKAVFKFSFETSRDAIAFKEEFGS